MTDKSVSDLTQAVASQDTDLLYTIRPSGTPGQPALDMGTPAGVLRQPIIDGLASGAVPVGASGVVVPAGPVGSNIITRSLNDKLNDARSVLDFGSVSAAGDASDAIYKALMYATDGDYIRWPAETDNITDPSSGTRVDPSFGVTKGPGIYFPPNRYVYDRAGFDLAGRSSILRLVGDSALAVRIVIPPGQNFIKSTTNPVGMEVQGIHFSGGAGALVFTSTAVNANRPSFIQNCVFTRQTVCAVGHCSQDWPGLTVAHNLFRCADSAIALLMSGLAADGGVLKNIFQGFKYALKLGTVDLATDKGPATPLNILGNSFYRYNVPSGACYDVWIVPNQDTNEGAGRGLMFAYNKFGNEQLTDNDKRILIARENTSAGANATEYAHSTSTYGGYVRGMTYRDNNVNNSKDGVSIPFIYSYTGGIEHTVIDDIIEDTQRGPYIVYDDGLSANSDFVLGATTNSLSLRRALGASGYAFPDPVSRYGTWTVEDPHGYVSLPSVPIPHDGGGMPGDFISKWTTISASSGMTISGTGTTGATVTNAIGNTAEGLEVTCGASDGRCSANFNVTTAGRQMWIEGDLLQGSSLSLTEVQVEIGTGSAVSKQRTYKLNDHWRRFVIGFVPPTTDTYFLRIRANDYSPGAKTKFRVGRVRAYHASRPVDYQVRLLQNEVTLDPVSLAAGTASATATMTITGAALGDFALASFSLDVTGVKFCAAVSATNTVKYWYENHTAGTVDLASGTLRVRVLKA